MEKEKFDFAGWATKNDLKCSDGRTIRKGAFKDQDGKKVPLVWNHQHNSADNVLGHALLQDRPEGVWAYCSFNDSDAGRNAKLLVEHGDIDSLSIFANKLTQDNDRNVLHGKICEVSLVLAGANPGATIMDVVGHSDDGSDGGLEIYPDQPLDYDDVIYHTTIGASEEPKKEPEKEPEKKPEKKISKKAEKDTEDEVAHADGEEGSKGEPGDKDGIDVAAIWKTFTEEEKELTASLAAAIENNDASDEERQALSDAYNALPEEKQTVVAAVIGKLAEEGGDAEHSDDEEDEEIINNDEGDNEMKHNFENNAQENDAVLTGAEVSELIHNATDISGSFRAAVKALDLGDITCEAFAHGIDNTEVLYPNFHNVQNVPVWVKRQSEWVNVVLNGVHSVPYSRIRSMYADITEYDARAKGYITGNEKLEEVFPVFQRTTSPQTIYKKQSLDRDIILDIIDLDVVAWLKGEMRIMLDEEIARAILVGDGRNALSPEKIKEDCIRPIWTDDNFYSIKKQVVVAADATDDQKAKAFIRATVKSRKDYRGKGNPVLFTSEDMLTDMLLMEDTTGRVIYDTIDKLCTALRVTKIVTVPDFENRTRQVNGATHYLCGIYLNLDDYDKGADKGASPNMFEDFDIDFNKEKYLIETRCSGALVVPKSAVVLELVYGFAFGVAGTAGSTTRYGKTAAQLQSNVFVHDEAIQGNLKYVTGYTGFSGEASEQEGNYLALDFTVPDGATLKIKVGNGNFVDATSDGYAVIRMNNKIGEKMTVQCIKNDVVLERVISLSALKLEAKA